MVRVVAHRGDCSKAPENTLASVRAALHAGCHDIEIDVQLSKDGVPVLFHDRDFKRLTSSSLSGTIADHLSVELLTLQIEESQRLADVSAPLTLLSTVVDCIAQWPEVTLFVEVKRVTLERFSVAEVYNAVITCLQPIREQVVLISFSLPFIQYSKTQGGWSLGIVLESDAFLSDGEIAQSIKALEVDYLFCNIGRLPEHINFSQAHGIWVIYEVASRAVLSKLRARGLTMVESFFPKKLMAGANE
jgi:glycerophosphoryl diester phosphodiesterase